jgi:hypothetical protein
MLLRTLGVFAGIETIAAFPAQPQYLVGDIVDPGIGREDRVLCGRAAAGTPVAAQQRPSRPRITHAAASRRGIAAGGDHTCDPAAPADLAGEATIPPPVVLSSQRWSGIYVGTTFGVDDTHGGRGETCTSTATGTSSAETSSRAARFRPTESVAAVSSGI